METSTRSHGDKLAVCSKMGENKILIYIHRRVFDCANKICGQKYFHSNCVNKNLHFRDEGMLYDEICKNKLSATN